VLEVWLAAGEEELDAIVLLDETGKVGFGAGEAVAKAPWPLLITDGAGDYTRN
jgi:hypothetical protein